MISIERSENKFITPIVIHSRIVAEGKSRRVRIRIMYIINIQTDFTGLINFNINIELFQPTASFLER